MSLSSRVQQGAFPSSSGELEIGLLSEAPGDGKSPAKARILPVPVRFKLGFRS